MQLPNALKGISNIYHSEILKMLANMALGIVIVFIMLVNNSYQNVEELQLDVIIIVFLACGFVAGVLNVIALVLMMKGVVQTAKDEPYFKPLVYLTILNIIVTVAAVFLRTNTFIGNIAAVIGQLVSLVSSLIIILGISRLATRLRNNAVNGKCAGIVKIVLAVGVLSLVMRLFSVFMVSRVSQAVTVSLAVFSLVLSVVQYIAYLPLLSAAKQMLAAQTEATEHR